MINGNMGINSYKNLQWNIVRWIFIYFNGKIAMIIDNMRNGNLHRDIERWYVIHLDANVIYRMRDIIRDNNMNIIYTIISIYNAWVQKFAMKC